MLTPPYPMNYSKRWLEAVATNEVRVKQGYMYMYITIIIMTNIIEKILFLLLYSIMYYIIIYKFI